MNFWNISKFSEENEEKPDHQKCIDGRCILPEYTCPTDQGVPCHFPFTFQGVEYGKCTKAGYEYPWCAVSHAVPGAPGMVCDKCWKNETYTWGNCITEGNEHCFPEGSVDPEETTGTISHLSSLFIL